MDKSIAMIGGFGDKGLDEAQDVLKDLLAHINSFQQVNFVESNSGVLSSAPLDTPANAFKFERFKKKKHAGIQHAGLWVAENRIRAGRNRSKIVGKLTKFSLNWKT